MNILVLDDSKKRHDAYDRFYQGHNVVHIYHYKDCIDQLSYGGWDIVELDQDINDDIINVDVVIDDKCTFKVSTGLDVCYLHN